MQNEWSAAAPQKHWFDYALVGTRTLWYLLGTQYIVSHAEQYLNASDPFGIGDGVWIVLFLYTLAYGVPMLLFLCTWIPRFYSVLADLLLSGGFYFLLEVNVMGGFDFFNFPVMMIGYTSAGPFAVFAAALSVGAMPVLVGWIWGVGFDAAAGLAIEFGVLFGCGHCFRRMIDAYRKKNEMYALIAEQNRALEIYAKQIEALTLQEERNRLSRELHDTVGHTFTTTITGMDAVLYLIDVAPQEAKNNLRELLNVMCKGLNEVRNHIHRIASDDQERSLTLALSQIAREFSIHTDTKICLDTQGSERAVSENVRLTFIRCLQESLTNAKKHGMASHIRLVLVYTEESITLSIADDGKGTGKLAEGFGLRAMGERVANVYGRLDIVSRESGTIIRCTIPTKSVVGTE